MCDTGATICGTISRNLKRLLCTCSKRQWMKIFVLPSNIWSESCHWVMSQISESCHIWMSHVTCRWRYLHIAQILGVSHVTESCHMCMQQFVHRSTFGQCMCRVCDICSGCVVHATVRASLHIWTMSCHWVISRFSESSCKWISRVTCGWRYSRVASIV